MCSSGPGPFLDVKMLMLRPRKEQMKVIDDISHLVGVEGGKGSLTYFCLLESHNFHLSDIKRNDLANRGKVTPLCQT